MKNRSPTYSRPFLSDPLLSVCVLSALKLFPVHVSHVLCQLLHLPADSSCMAGKIQNIKSTGLIDPIILLVSWQTTFTVRQTVLSTGRHTDDIQSRVLSTGWHTEQSSAEQTTLIVQHFFPSTDWKDNTPSTAYSTEHRLTDWHAESDSAVSCPAGSFKNSNISANLEIVLLIDEDKWALTSRGASHFKKDDKML